MDKIPKSASLDIELVITEHTAKKICELLSDYLSDHWDQELRIEMLVGEHDVMRRVYLEDKE